MGHGSHGSWVKSSMGHLGHGSLSVTHSLLCGVYTVRSSRRSVARPIAAIDRADQSPRRSRLFTRWPPYVIGGAIIFLPCGFYLLSIYLLRLPYFHTRCGLSANLECMSETCCARLVENAGRKNDAKLAIWAPLHNFVGLYLRN